MRQANRISTAWLSMMSVVLLALTPGGSLPSPLFAPEVTTIVVNTMTDENNTDGDCSLREAILAANADTSVDACPAGNGDDTIVVPAGTYTVTIPGQSENAALTGDLDITANVVIVGAGAASTTIDGGGEIIRDRVFNVIGSDTIVTIGGMTIRNGVPGMSHYGGGISSDGQLLLVGVTVRDNSTGIGGGVYSDGSLTVIDSTFTGNVVDSSGGGIDSGHHASTLTITNSVFSDNVAGLGGGIAHEGGNMSLTGSLVNHNTAEGGGQLGGGVSVRAEATAVISDTVISDNTAGGGGGIRNSGTLTVANSLVSHNVAIIGGGIANSGLLVLTDSLVTGNTADRGGGLYNYTYNADSDTGMMTVTNSVISDNEATRNDPDYGGGGLFNTGTGGAVAVFVNSALTGNTSRYSHGGAIYNDHFGQVTLVNSTLSGNVALKDGGGIYDRGNSIYMTIVSLYNTTIANNRTELGEGGGIHIWGSMFNFGNSIVAGNNDDGNEAPDCFTAASGVVNSLGYNLIQAPSGCNISGDLTGNLSGVSPGLGPLQDNGGPTPTHALLTDSLALDAGNPAGCTDQLGNVLVVDQRGMARPVDGDSVLGARCDIGAFELSPIRYYLPIMRVN
jgi:CSLREA domain-containing protein